MNIDGTGLTKISQALGTSGMMVYDFVVSPDGAKVAYRVDSVTYALVHLFIVNIDGTNRVQLTPAMTGSQDALAGYSFTPDSSKVIFLADSRVDAFQELWVVNVDGTNRISLSGNMSTSANWVTSALASPDSIHVAYRGDMVVDGVDELFLVNIDGTNRIRVTSSMVAGGEVSTATRDWAWTADSNYLVFLAKYNAPEVQELYSVTTSGVITKLNGTVAAGAQVMGIAPTLDTFTLNPAADRVAYMSDEEVAGQWNLYTVKPDGSERVKLFNLDSWSTVLNFVWHPNGQSLVARGDFLADGAMSLMQVKVDGSRTGSVSFPTSTTSSIYSSFQISSSYSIVLFVADVQTRAVFDMWKVSLPF